MYSAWGKLSGTSLYAAIGLSFSYHSYMSHAKIMQGVVGTFPHVCIYK